MKTPFFTVFTPTYNRAHTLHRVYDSLIVQTFRNFEWIIVDDGSKDNTGELVKSWQRNAPFQIRYIYQENQGKHIAINIGVKEAKGELFLIFDSDDSCVPESLECFRFYWGKIPEEEKKYYSTISALCMDLNGKVIGEEYPAEIVDADSVWRQIMLRSSGDRWGANRTDVLKNFPFPEISGEKFIPEGIVWNRMSQLYKARFINKKLLIHEYREDGLTKSSIKIRADSPNGARLYYKELSDLDIPIGQKAKAFVNYIRFSFHFGFPLSRIVRESGAPYPVFLLLIVGYLMFCSDKSSP